MTEIPDGDRDRLHDSLEGLLHDDLARLRLCGVDVGLIVACTVSYTALGRLKGHEYISSTGVKIFIPGPRI